MAMITTLTEVSVANNPITKKGFYRGSVLKRIPYLKILDGLVKRIFFNFKDVTYEELEKVDAVQVIHDLKSHPLIHFA
jgi:hypothetical protein